MAAAGIRRPARHEIPARRGTLSRPGPRGLAVDMGSGTITITPAGELTLRNVRGLLPVA